MGQMIMSVLGSAWLRVAVVFAVTLVGETVFACPPCPSTLNLEQSLSKADLVIVGERIASDGPEGRAQNIQVKVLKVLKGKLKGRQVAARSWHGMCPYGIIVGDGKYLMILKESSEMPGMYDSVDSGCSVSTLSVKSEKVSVDGKRIPLKEFQRRYKLKVVD
jgi:hypothetical protein